ncbi:MAG: hypothetical protein ACUVR8_03655 [Acidobacteriota bacterium]
MIDNQRDAFRSGSVWGQRLFFNANGQRASLTGERESNFVAKGGDKTSPTPAEPDRSRDDANLNMVLLIQVPLKQRLPLSRSEGLTAAPKTYKPEESKALNISDIENAVIGHGDLEGPFTEIDNLPIERDERFPVRITVQFYKATSNGIATEADIAAIKANIEQIYARSEDVGSLVTGGDTGRVTEYEGVKKVQPTDWWEDFWEQYEASTGISRYEAIRRLRELLGTNFRQKPVCELYLRNLLRISGAKH